VERLPDLYAKLEPLEPPIRMDDGSYLLLVTAVVGNAGDAAAAPFRISAHAVLDDEQQRPFQVPLVADEGSGLENEQEWTTHTRGPLPPGESLQFTGRIRLPSLFAGHTAGVSILVDSCAGIEVFDDFTARYCAVQELDEGNNGSTELRYELPPPVIGARGQLDTRTGNGGMPDG
jgi:hypothetical protein